MGKSAPRKDTLTIIGEHGKSKDRSFLPRRQSTRSPAPRWRCTACQSPLEIRQLGESMNWPFSTAAATSEKMSSPVWRTCLLATPQP